MTVLVAPIAAEVLASTLMCPRLHEEVAFGTRQRDLAEVAPGTTVFIYVAPDHSRCNSLLQPGFVTWIGTLGRLVPAVAQGPRRGMHPDPAMRPPFAELYDYKDATVFFHVLGLKPVVEAIPFNRFRDGDGATLFGRSAPSWIARGVLTEEKAPSAPKMPTLRAA